MRTSPWSIGVVVVAAAAASCTAAQQVNEPKSVKQIRWSDEKAAGRLATGEVVERPGEDPAEQLVLRQSAEGSKNLHVLTLDDPGVGPPAYMLSGRVRYEDVKKAGYLELLNYLPGGGPYFTRTLAPSGPMQLLEGTSNWREFQLPFYLTMPDGSRGPRPTKLELNVALPGGGTVYLGDLKLAQLSDGLAVGSTGWWSSRTAVLVGGIGVVLLGCLGALVGILAWAGRARAVVVGILIAWMIASAAALLVGIVALVLGQPFAVYCPLLLLGVLGTLHPAFLLPGARHRYRQQELRRMEALDVA